MCALSGADRPVRFRRRCQGFGPEHEGGIRRPWSVGFCPESSVSVMLPPAETQTWAPGHRPLRGWRSWAKPWSPWTGRPWGGAGTEREPLSICNLTSLTDLFLSELRPRSCRVPTPEPQASGSLPRAS